MKVNIGPYRNDLIPVSRWQSFYEAKRSNGVFLEEEDYTRLDKIVIGLFDKLEDFVRPINRWSNNRKRKVNIHIDYYDVWSADHTLGMIIAPVLKKLQSVKHGSPFVDDEDVPENLKSTSAPAKENDWDTDDNHEARWEYVLGEMIWAFEQHADPDTGEAQFSHNVDQLEMTFEETGDPTLDSKGRKTIRFNHQKDPTKPPYWVDEEGKKAHYERITNGRRLFTKYYDGLWD